MSATAPAVIEIQGVSKSYRRFERFRYRALELATLGLIKRHRMHHALSGVGLRVEAGEVVGLIGENGCGKSTLLRMIAGVCFPDEGTVRVDGRVAALLELGTGFHQHFTGRDNAMLQAALHGLGRADCQKVMPYIEAFAGIGDAFDDLLRTYSSGMVVRLAFAAAVAVEPDILLVDEALAVGDAAFKERCLERMQEYKAQGRTILFVSHDLDLVQRFCTRVVLLEQGRNVADGEPAALCQLYLEKVGARRRERQPR